MPDFLPAYAEGSKGQSGVFLFCDHATNALPNAYRSLGLTTEQINDHIAFDPGAAALTHELSRRLGARGVLRVFALAD